MSAKEGGQEGLFWESQTWGLSNSEEDSGRSGCRGGAYDHQEKKTGEKPPVVVSTSNSPEGGERMRKKQRMNGKGNGIITQVKQGKGGGGESDHEIHIWTERERRKKMRNMFANLHALLPQLPPKADKSTIVDEAVNYIKTLEQTLQNLEKQKQERFQGATTFGYEKSSLIGTPKVLNDSREAFIADQASSSSPSAITASKPSTITPILIKHPVLFRTWTSSNVVLNICGDQAQISICSPKKPGLFTAICYVLERHNIGVLSAHVSSDSTHNVYMIQAYHASGSGSEQFGEAFPVEEIYRQAAGEIMCWVSP